jgi:hypothetical protein
MQEVIKKIVCKLLTLYQRWLLNSKGYLRSLTEIVGINEKTRVYALGDGLYFAGYPLHLFRHTMAQYYLAATNWSLAYEASLGGWENTEVLSKCYGGIPEHIRAQIAKLIHVRFDTLNVGIASQQLLL